MRSFSRRTVWQTVAARRDELAHVPDAAGEVAGDVGHEHGEDAGVAAGQTVDCRGRDDDDDTPGAGDGGHRMGVDADQRVGTEQIALADGCHGAATDFKGGPAFEDEMERAGRVAFAEQGFAAKEHRGVQRADEGVDIRSLDGAEQGDARQHLQHLVSEDGSDHDLLESGI